MNGYFPFLYYHRIRNFLHRCTATYLDEGAIQLLFEQRAHRRTGAQRRQRRRHLRGAVTVLLANVRLQRHLFVATSAVCDVDAPCTMFHARVRRIMHHALCVYDASMLMYDAP